MTFQYKYNTTFFTTLCFVFCVGVNCGSYGMAKSCHSCPIIYPKDSCLGDCGWELNKNTKEYNCVDRGNCDIYLKVEKHILFWHVPL